MKAVVTRRSAMGGLAAVAATAPVFRAEASSVSADVADLLEHVLARKESYREIDDILDELYDALPAWARPGPSMIRSDGTKFGDLSPFPEVADLDDLPTGGAVGLIRPYISDLVEFGRLRLDLCGANAERRKECRRATFEKVRAWIARRREQRAECEKVGIPYWEKLQAAIDAELIAADRVLESIARTEPGNLDVAAGRIIIALDDGDGGGEYAFTVLLKTLAALKPHLSPRVRRIARELLARHDVIAA